MGEGMSEKELVDITINEYCDLLRINNRKFYAWSNYNNSRKKKWNVRLCCTRKKDYRN